MAYQDPMAQAILLAYCHWDPTEVVTDATVTLDGNGTPLLALPSLHVTGVSAVTVTDRYGDLFTLDVGPGNTDVAWSENGLLTYKGCYFGGVWPQDGQNVSVTYSGGYEPIPADLSAALDKISARLGSNAPATPALTKRLGRATLSYAQSVADGGLLMVEQMVLDRYRIMQVA